MRDHILKILLCGLFQLTKSKSNLDCSLSTLCLIWSAQLAKNHRFILGIEELQVQIHTFTEAKLCEASSPANDDELPLI